MGKPGTPQGKDDDTVRAKGPKKGRKSAETGPPTAPAASEPSAPNQAVMEAEPVAEQPQPAVPWDTGPKPGRDELGRILPGTVLNPGGAPKQLVQIGNRLRKALLVPHGEDGRTRADELVEKVAEAIANEPDGAMAFKWLTWLEEREQGRAPLRLLHGMDPYGLEPPEVVTPKVPGPTEGGDAAALDAYLQRLPPGERATTVRVLLEVAAHVPGAVRLPVSDGQHAAPAAPEPAGMAPAAPAGGAG